LKPLIAPQQVYADLGKVIADQNFHNAMKPAFLIVIKNKDIMNDWTMI
jgi:hypothetical protein